MKNDVRVEYPSADRWVLMDGDLKIATGVRDKRGQRVLMVDPRDMAKLLKTVNEMRRALGYATGDEHAPCLACGEYAPAHTPGCVLEDR
jgi:hypothetical protein